MTERMNIYADKNCFSLFGRFFRRAAVSLCTAVFVFCAEPSFCAGYYWEEPEQLTKTDSRFPSVVTNGSDSYIFWQDVDSRNERIYLSCRYQDGAGEWRENLRFAGPFSYSGEVPDMYSAAVSGSGTIAVAVLNDANSVSVYVSNDSAASFSRVKDSRREDRFIAPNIYACASGGFALFASSSRGSAYSSSAEESPADEDSFSVLQFYLNCAYSPNGIDWGDFEEFSPSMKLKNPFAPVLCADGNEDVVVFQAQHQEGARISYQLYEARGSARTGRWSEPVLITGKGSVSSSEDFTLFQNQRPNVCSAGGAVYVAWERRERYSASDSIWIAQIDRNGLVPYTAEKIASGNSRRAVLFPLDGTVAVTWFDSRSGVEAVYFARRNGSLWEEEKVSSGKAPHLFAYPIFIYEKNNTSQVKQLGFVWQKFNGITKDVPSVCILSPDISVQPPAVSAVNVKQSARTKNKKPKLKITLPHDSSEIAGYVYCWTQDKDELPVLSEDNLLLPRETSLTLTASAEGKWYFKACAYDYAGNWSEPAVFSYYYDQTPPRKVVFEAQGDDETGFMPSNTFSIRWTPDVLDDDITGYTYAVKRLSSVDGSFASTPNHPSAKTPEEQRSYTETLSASYSRQISAGTKLSDSVNVLRPEISFRNYPNGLYVLTVAAVDEAGFTGEPAVIPVILNKYVPHTAIAKVETSSSRTGEIFLTITGSDFLIDGTITKIIIDKKGKAPYDYEVSSGFTVKSNTSVSGIPLDADLEEGSYFVGILHSDRGLTMSYRPILTIEATGTVKIENPYQYVPDYYAFRDSYTYRMDIGTILFVLTVAASLLFLIYFAAAIIRNITDACAVRTLLYQTVNQTETQTKTQRGIFMKKNTPRDILQKDKNSRMKGRGSLLYEIVGFTYSLIILIVVSVTVPFYRFRIAQTEKELSESLMDRVNVLLSSLSSGAKAYMPTNNVLELSMLPDQISGVQEAVSATIVGFSSESGVSASREYKDSVMHVWASNDSEIAKKIDTPQLILGISRISEEFAGSYDDICLQLNSSISSELGKTSSRIASLNAEGDKLSLMTDRNSMRRLSIINEESQRLTVFMNEQMERFARDGSGSQPPFDAGHLDSNQTSYMFYRPIIFRMGNSEEFVRGLVFVRVSTVSLLKAVADAKRSIIIIVSIVAGVIIVIGGIGSVIIGRHIAAPIRQLEKFVQKIADEKHKENLAGEKKNISLSRNDEIGRLGAAMNRLKEELAYAAIEEKLTNDGKAVQKAFLPLDKTDSGTGQKTTASYSDKNIEAFGYYEGASAVSGDYFDYKKLDDRWYVFIKSDASGHGTPAGLIMTVVATLFNKFFENWSAAKNGTNITKLVYQINDFLESLGLKGKFATIILILFDADSGQMYLCNAGDNIVHLYDTKASELKVISLKETPAAGPFPSFMIDMKGGFALEKAAFMHGDILFLYTDGIEEATRLVRDENGQVMQEEVNRKIEDKKELLEADRVKQVIEAVFARKTFTLKKEGAFGAEDTLVFDFTGCEGNSVEAITALIAVEKVFRMYKPLSATEADTIKVDRRIDSFLKEHFNLYGKYCLIDSSASADDIGTEYVQYNFIMEDDQADDLTLLAIRRQ